VLKATGQSFRQKLVLDAQQREGRTEYAFLMEIAWPDRETTRARSFLGGGKVLRSRTTRREDLAHNGRELLQEEVHFPTSSPLYPDDTYSNFAIFFAFRGLVSERLRTGSIHMAIPSGAMTRLNVRCTRGKWVRVPAGRFRCVKVTARTDLSYFIGSLGGFLNQIGYYFIPKSDLWYMEDPPHLLVKYEGLVLISPRNEPIEMELMQWYANGPTQAKISKHP